MKILVIAHDIPYPPIHGGRVDMWRRLNLLHSIGAEIFLVTWSYQPLDDESRRALTSICAKFYVLPIRRTWKHRSSRLKYLLTLPLYEAMRVLEVKVWRDLLILVEKFNPYIIWLDGLYGGKLAVDFSNYLKIPIYYRSHNIEYQYMRKLSNQASNYRAKVAALLGCWNLHSFENKIMKVAIHVFDVSIDDIAIWLKNGYTHISYLPGGFKFEVQHRCLTA